MSVQAVDCWLAVCLPGTSLELDSELVPCHLEKVDRTSWSLQELVEVVEVETRIFQPAVSWPQSAVVVVVVVVDSVEQWPPDPRILPIRPPPRSRVCQL